jgi:uncharacterized protein with FMN-binding domain
MDQQPNSKKKEIIAALAVLVVIAGIITAVSLTNKKSTTDSNVVSNTTDSQSKTPVDTTKSEATTSTDTTQASPQATNEYKDGTYSASGSYDSPGGTESITIGITLKNDTIIATSADSGANDPEAHEYQDDFIGGYKQLIVGKSVDSVRLSRVSGSSLTSQGFNSALTKIKNQAKQNA